MKIYTKSGDKGKSSLYDGSRCSKTSIIFQTVGEIDELSSRIGLLISKITKNIFKDNHESLTLFLREIQRNLQDLNSVLASGKKKVKQFTEEYILKIERKIDELDSQNSNLTKFILPGVTEIDSISHTCRTQTRKVERFMCLLLEETIVDIPSNEMKYINRLSDFFFVLSRWICHIQNLSDFFIN